MSAPHDADAGPPDHERPTTPTTPRTRALIGHGLRKWFRTPPRRHGEVVAEREVSFLELFYDVVYVVLIGRATHHLAEHVDGRRTRISDRNRTCAPSR